MKTNNKQKNYIYLKYNPNNYQIFIISDTQKIKLKSDDAKIMHRVLNNFKNIQVDEDTYIFLDVYLILLAFKKEKNKRNKKYVNRKKSRNLKLCIVLSASLAVGGAFVYNHSQNKDMLKFNTEEETNNKINIKPEKIKVTIDNETIEVKNPDLTNKEYEKEEFKDEEFIENNQFAILNYHDETPGDEKALEIASQYDELFLKYEKRYGIDANLLKAIAAQESSGRQDVTNGYAVGLMGIENTWNNDKITAYNFETGQYEQIIVDYEKAAKNADYCVMIRTAGFQQSFYTVIKSKLLPDDEKLSYTLQRTNMGATRMQNILATGEHWMEGRKKVDRGDKNYFENVLSRLPNGTTIKIKMPNGTYFSTIITNLSLEKNYSKN